MFAFVGKTIYILTLKANEFPNSSLQYEGEKFSHIDFEVFFFLYDEILS